MDTSANPLPPSPPPVSPVVKAKNGRPVQYPHQLKVYLSIPMAESLRRICQRYGIPEGIGARIAIAQYCAQLDPQYRGGNA
jgi:hypothetical protein